jgi:hypothetical protein
VITARQKQFVVGLAGFVLCLLIPYACTAQTTATPSNRIPRFNYAPDFAAMAAGGASAAVLTWKHHPVIAGNVANWTGFYSATFSGRHIANSCRIEDARNGVGNRFGTAPVYGMPSHYARNAAAATAAVSLVSLLLHAKHHDRAAALVPAFSGAYQGGVAGGNLMGGCN